MQQASTPHELARLLAIARGSQALQAVAAAVETGLFACLAEKPATADVIARRARCGRPAIERLLQCLCGIGLLQQRATEYALSRPARRYLNPSSDWYLGPYLLHQATLINPWSQLACSLRRNSMAPPERQRIMNYRRQLALYLKAMDSIGRLKTGRIMDCIAVRRYDRMLDVGGGMGTYAAAFARRNKRLRATIVDLPDVVKHARAAIRTSGCADRVTAIACRVPDDPLPDGPFDLALVSNLLHLYQPQACRRILRQAVAVLARGGTFVVHDYLFGCGDAGAAGLFDLTMLVGTPQGQCYKRQDIASWMRSVGIKKIRAADVPAGTAIVWGEKA